MLRSFGHIEWEPTQEILRSTIKAEKDAQYGLAAGCREGGKTLRGIENQGNVEEGAFGAGTVHPFSDTYVLLLCIQGASTSREAPGRLSEAILMERH